jgi:DNA gyrase/topoisomerase IV subunit A
MAKDKIKLNLTREGEEMLLKVIDKRSIRVMSVIDYVDPVSKTYMMNRIIGRDIPSIIDGLTPVERRILYTMYKKGLNPKSKFDRLAAIIGHAIEIVYPHGDGPIYNTIVRLGRTWNMMLPYVAKEGNYGNRIDREAGGMRYIKGKLSNYAWDCFFTDSVGLKQPIFDTRINYNYSDYEPIYLTSKYPNILMQWNIGIGVGAASTIVGFNPTELMEATIKLVDDPKAKIHIYPDHPTPIIITNKKELKNCFDQHKFRVKFTSPWETRIDKTRGGETKYYIVFTAAHLNCNVSRVIEKIIEIKREDEKSPTKRFKELKDIKAIVQKENNEEKLEIIIEYERGADPNVVADKILKIGDLSPVSHAMNTVVKDGALFRATPRTILLEWINNRILQKSRWIQSMIIDTAKSILLKKALIVVNNSGKKGMDLLLDIIRHKKNPDGSRPNEEQIVDFIIAAFPGLSPMQALYILEKKISTLSAMSMGKLETEVKQHEKDYMYYSSICKDEEICEIIKEELKDGIKKYGRPRMAELTNMDTDTDINNEEEKFIAYKEDMMYIVSDPANLNKMEMDRDYRVISVKNGDFVTIYYSDGTIDNVQGSSYNVNEVEGVPQIINLSKNICKLEIYDKKNKFLIVCSKDGYVKMLDYKSTVKKSNAKIIKLAANDSVADVISIHKDTSLDGYLCMMNSEKAYYVSLSSVPLLQKGSQGNRLIKNLKGKISSLNTVKITDEYLLLYGENGYVKVVPTSYLTISKKDDDFVTMTNKNIKGVLGLGPNMNRIVLYELEGKHELTVSVHNKTVLFSYNGAEKEIEVGYSISTPSKVFKKSKNEYYEILNV